MLPAGLNQIECYYYAGLQTSAALTFRLEYQLTSVRGDYRYDRSNYFWRRQLSSSSSSSSSSEDYSYTNNYWSSVMSSILPRQLLTGNNIWHKAGIALLSSPLSCQLLLSSLFSVHSGPVLPDSVPLTWDERENCHSNGPVHASGALHGVHVGTIQ
jgi:hypothetical protein